MRDGLSLLDQCASATVGELTAEAVYTCLGIAGERKCGQLLSSIAAHNTKEALQLFNQLYTDGKDLGAMLDELACLIRDLLVLKTAPGAGITMLSGVASDQEVQSLSGQLSSGELVRMMGLVQQTVADFSRSASRRMDAELCILEMAQPELSLDAKALNARLTKLEDQIKSGSFTVMQQPAAAAVSTPAVQPVAGLKLLMMRDSEVELVRECFRWLYNDEDDDLKKPGGAAGFPCIGDAGASDGGGYSR